MFRSSWCLAVAASLLILPCAAQNPAGVLYSTTIPNSNGANQPAVTAMAADGSGNVYITGSVTANGFRSTPGVLQPSFAGGAGDAFVAKFDSSGTLVFLTYLGGSSGDMGTSIAVNSAGQIYVGGTTGSADFPLAGAPYRPMLTNGGTFIAEMSGDGKTLIWSTILNGGSGQLGLAPNGSLYVFSATLTQGISGIFTADSVLNLAANGQLVSSTNLAPGATLFSVAADGSIFVAGNTSGAAIEATPGAWQTTLAASYGGFVAKLNPDTLSIAWLSFVSGNGSTALDSIAADPDGSIWVSGLSGGSSFPVLPGPFGFLGPAGSVLVHLSADGSQALTSTYFPSANWMGAAPSGNLFFATNDTIFHGFAGSPWPCLEPGVTQDAFIGQIDSGGQNIPWGTYAGPSVPFGPMAALNSTSVAVAGIDAQGDIVLSALATTPGAPGLVESCIAQAGSPNLSGPLAPGEVFSIYGADYGPAQGVGAQNSGGEVGTSLGGIQVTVEGTPVPLLYVSAAQINAVAPFLLEGRTAAHIKIVTASGASNEVVLGVRDVRPEIFAVSNQNGTQNNPNNPAHAGDYLSIWASGLGQTNPPGMDGAIPTAAGGAPLAAITLQAATVESEEMAFGGAPAPVNVAVLYAGNAPGLVSGVVQINFQMPDLAPPFPSSIPVSGPPYAANLTMTVGGAAASTYIWFE